LAIYSAEPNAFNPEEVRLLEEMAADLAFGVNSLRAGAERVRAEAELEQYRHHLEELVQQRTSDLEDARAAALSLMEEANLQRQAAEEALAEKVVLLREVHHRVKNNLNTVATMLYFQAKEVNDARTLAAFQESQNRIQSMARLHEHLYRSKNLTTVDMKGYLSDLVMDLGQSLGEMTVPVQLETEGMMLDVDRAVPCGLLINELVSNALKHAFRDQDAGGSIQVRLVPQGETVMLSVGDNGMGLPDGMDVARVQSLGLRLVTMLVRQLRGTLEVRSGKGTGTVFAITFPASGRED